MHTAAETPGDRRRARFGVALVAVWALACVVIGASLMTSHWVSLPSPSTEDAALRRSLRRLHPHSGWLAVHFLDEECACSRQILRHLKSRRALRDVEECVVLLGNGEAAPELRAAGFAVHRCERDALAEKYHVEAAPLLVVADPEGAPVYVGGYTDRKQGLAVRDVAILEACRNRSVPQALPVFGCGASPRLRDILDPFALKYRSE